MRSRANIVRQLENLRMKGHPDDPTRNAWIAALEWVLQEGLVLRPEFADMSAFGQLVMAAMAARNGLRSYQYGNVATELAAEIADELDRVIPPALQTRNAWIAALEWVLQEGLVLRPEFADMSPFGQLVMAAMSARSALRSYQYGIGDVLQPNVATELAKEIADELDRVIPPALEERGRVIDQLKSELAELDGVLNDLRASLTKTRTEGTVG